VRWGVKYYPLVVLSSSLLTSPCSSIIVVIISWWQANASRRAVKMADIPELVSSTLEASSELLPSTVSSTIAAMRCTTVL
jgi:hypothetical protein